MLPVSLNQLAHTETALSSPGSHNPAGLPVPHPTPSFWINSPGANPLAGEGSTGPLTDDADVCIIGSGITGVSVAYHLAQAVREREVAAPLKVVILDARDFCSGATGRNGGHLTPNPFRKFCKTAAAFGTAQALRALAVEHHTASEIVRILSAENLTGAVDLVEGGHISLLFTKEEAAEARDDYAAAQAAGADLGAVEWLSREYMQSHHGAAYPAVRFPGHNLWPLKLVTHLYALAQGASPHCALALHMRTPVTAISPGPGARRWVLHTPRGRVAAAHIVHATNAHASHLLPHMAGPAGVVPTRGQVVALRARASAAELTTSGWHANEGFEYWFPRPVAGTECPLVILGGGREAAGPRFETYEEDDGGLNARAGRALREFLPAVLPGKFEAGREPEIEWSGIMGFTARGDPFVGPVVDVTRPGAHAGQYVCAGYTGHGMTRAFGCAAVVADMVEAEMAGRGGTWRAPGWFPAHYLTCNR